MKATSLRAAAQTSTASLTDPGTAVSIELLVVDLQSLDERIHMGQKQLAVLIADDPDRPVPATAFLNALAMRSKNGIAGQSGLRLSTTWVPLSGRPGSHPSCGKFHWQSGLDSVVVSFSPAF